MNSTQVPKVACPVCSCQSELSIVATSPTYFRCQSCTFTWIAREDLEKMPEPDYVDYGYNESIRSNYPRLKNEYDSGLKRRLTYGLKTDSFEDLTFLDIGCASGEYLESALSLGFRSASGVEIDTVASDFASKHGEVVSDMSFFGGQKFDVVQIKNVLTNVPDPKSFLRSAVDLLPQDGLLLIDVLNHAGVTSLGRRLISKSKLQKPDGRFGSLRPPYVINGFTRRSLTKLCEDVGLEMTSIEDSYLGSPDVPYYATRRIDSLVKVCARFGRGTMIISSWRQST